jgi:beta-lactamase class A
MNRSRRALLTTVVTSIGVASAHASDDAAGERRGHRDSSGLATEIPELFAGLPGRKSFKIWVPATESAPEFVVGLHEEERLFSASANKALILCERLRQLDSSSVEKQLMNHKLKLDASVWSFGSDIFNPPDLSGSVSERTTMEAMIIHSDNTATDMILKEAGVDKVRQFIASIGLKNTLIPDSTRALGGYLLGAPNYKTITWEELLSISSGSFVNPPLNDVETLASSASDLVSFYGRTLRGRFFEHRQTLQQFRRILALGDINYLVPFPLGLTGYGKAGYFDSPGHHARCIAGGIYFSGRWAFFATILNWDEPEVDDPETVTAYFRATRRAIELIRDCLGN